MFLIHAHFPSVLASETLFTFSQLFGDTFLPHMIPAWKYIVGHLSPIPNASSVCKICESLLQVSNNKKADDFWVVRSQDRPRCFACKAQSYPSRFWICSLNQKSSALCRLQPTLPSPRRFDSYLNNFSKFLERTLLKQQSPILSDNYAVFNLASRSLTKHQTFIFFISLSLYLPSWMENLLILNESAWYRLSANSIQFQIPPCHSTQSFSWLCCQPSAI